MADTYSFLEIPNQPPDTCISALPKGSPELLAYNKARYRQPLLQAVDDVWQRGEMLLSMGEWFNTPEVCWTEWGFVTMTDERGTARRPDGGLYGYTSNGKGDNEADFMRDGYVLKPVQASSAADATHEVLRRAIQRIRGVAGLGRVTGRDIVFGVDAIDAWVKSMVEIKGFCPECYPRDAGGAWHCARDVAVPTVEGSMFSAKWLRSLADSWGGESAEHLRAAANHYDRIAALFGPALQETGPEGYRAFVGDLGKQKLHAEKVLKPVKVELTTAGQEMAEALALKEAEE